MHRLIILACLAACLIAAGEARAMVIDTIYDTTVVRSVVPHWSYDGNYTSIGDSTVRTYVFVACLGGRSPSFVGFRNLLIPQGQELLIATCSLNVWNSDYNDFNMKVFAEDTASADSLKTADKTEITTRQKTTAFDLWITSNGNNWQSDTITSIIQEVVDRPDWASGNKLGLIFEAQSGSNGRWGSVEYGSVIPILNVQWQTMILDTTWEWSDLGDSVIYITGADSLDDTHLLADIDSVSSGNVNHVFTLGGAVPRHGYIRINTLFSELIPYEEAIIVSFACSTWANSSYAGETIWIHEGLKWWWEGAGSETSCGDSGATWNDFRCPDNEWGKVGSDSADDAGVFNMLDGDGPDRKATPETYVVIATGAPNCWYGFRLDSLAQRYYDGRSDQRGGLMFSGGWLSFISTENTIEPTHRVFFVLTYDLPGQEQPARKRLPFIRRP